MKNWAGNLTYSAARHVAPSSLDELQAEVAAAVRLRPAGTRHSFNKIGDTTGTLVSLARMPRVLEVDGTAGQVTVSAGTTYADLCPPLHAAGFALENMPSLPHITVAGACATGTHGS